MPKAIWNDVVLAESDEKIVVEGNHYFPPDSVKWEHFKESDQQTRCFWKGKANYYNVEARSKENSNAAWYYSNPSRAASRIKDYVAFWRGVRVLP